MSSNTAIANGSSDKGQDQEPGGTPDEELHQTVEGFLTQLWQADAQRGAWQIVHGIEGSIPLILALEGSHTLVALARAAHANPQLWAA
jgi:hypothetical protein